MNYFKLLLFRLMEPTLDFIDDDVLVCIGGVSG